MKEKLLKKVLLPLFLTTVPLTTVFSAEILEDKPEDKKEIALENKILEKLKEEKLISKSAEIESSFKPIRSNSAHLIIYINDEKSSSVVAKVVNAGESFETERKALMEDVIYADFVNKLRKKYECQLPIITRYFGDVVIEDNGAFLLERAYGKELHTILYNLESMDNERIKVIFTSMGKQSGLLDALSLKKENGGKRLRHSDSTATNFMYDEEKQQLYWIDTFTRDRNPSGGLTLVTDPDGLTTTLMFENAMPRFDSFYKTIVEWLETKMDIEFGNEPPDGFKKYKNNKEHRRKKIDELSRELMVKLRKKEITPKIYGENIRLIFDEYKESPFDGYTELKKLLDNFFKNGIFDESYYAICMDFLKNTYQVEQKSLTKQFLAIKSLSTGYCSENTLAKEIYNKKIMKLEGEISSFNGETKTLGLGPMFNLKDLLVE